MIKTWIFLVMMAGAGCATVRLPTPSFYTSRAITVETADLFDQRTRSTLGNENWKGDWLMRRERLEAIDGELRNAKPDLVVFQGVLNKKGNPSESDVNIIGKGALSDYQWARSLLMLYEDTQEELSHVVAAGLPLRISQESEDFAKVWAIGIDGFLSVAVVEMDEQPILVFNLQMPSGSNAVDLWYRFVTERILEVIENGAFCKDRIIVAGFIPSGPEWAAYQDMLIDLGLKDASTGFCQVASDCFTATPLNELYMATAGGVSPSQVDRILVRNRTAVLSGERVFLSPLQDSRYAKKYGLTQMWPTVRFGWSATIRLPRC